MTFKKKVNNILAMLPFSGVPSEKVTKAWGMIHDKAMLIDVRTEREFVFGSLDTAVNIPLSNMLNMNLKHINFNKPIVVYCQSGARSGMARRVLLKRGFTNVHNGGSLGALNRGKT